MDLVVVAYGLILAAGGTMGYVKKKSVTSMLAGVGSGAIMILCGIQIEERQNLATAVATFMTVLMGFRFYESRKFMPAGLVALLSSLIVIKLSN